MTIIIDCSTPEKLNRFADAIGKAAAGGQLVDIKAVAEKVGGKRTGTVEVEAYSTVLTSKQTSDTYYALGKAIRYAKMSGLMNADETSQLDAIYEMFGRVEPSPSFKTPEERSADRMESMADDCAKYGCD